MNAQSVARAPQPVLGSRSSKYPFVDDLEAARLARLADAAAAALPTLRLAVDAIVRSSHEAPHRTRDEARRLVARVIADLLHVQQGLALPVPPFRKSAQPPALIVRRHRRDVEVDDVADHRVVSVPTWAQNSEGGS